MSGFRNSWPEAEAAGSPILIRFMEIWFDAREPGERLPQKQNIDPVLLGRAGALPIIWLVERDASGTWRYRLSGEQINAIHGASLSGRALADLAQPDQATQIARRWDRCVDEPIGLRAKGHIYGKQHIYEGERVVLPLAGDDPEQCFILGVTDGELSQYGPLDKVEPGHRNAETTWIRLPDPAG